MADERGLKGRNPYDLQDHECTQLTAWFEGFDDADWSGPSRCAGWTRRDLLAHLVAVEEYFAACLDGRVAALMERYMASGATSLDEVNAIGVAAAGDTPAHELLSTWAERNAPNRAGFRAADGTDIDTSVGAYPCRLQAFHVAFEYAVHANDAGVSVADNEFDARQDWMAAVGRFALTEVKKDISVEPSGGRFMVRQGNAEATFSRDNFVAGVARRGDGISETDAALLG